MHIEIEGVRISPWKLMKRLSKIIANTRSICQMHAWWMEKNRLRLFGQKRVGPHVLTFCNGPHPLSLSGHISHQCMAHLTKMPRRRAPTQAVVSHTHISMVNGQTFKCCPITVIWMWSPTSYYGPAGYGSHMHVGVAGHDMERTSK